MSKKKPVEYWEYRLIDGNWAKHPTGYCRYYKGYLTEGLMNTHRCKQRKCKRLDLKIEIEPMDNLSTNGKKSLKSKNKHERR